MVSITRFLVVLSLCATMCAGRQSLRGTSAVTIADADSAGEQFDCSSTAGATACSNLHRLCCPDPSGEGDALCAPEGTQCMQLALG